jgi:hypothetical protein
MNFFDRLGNGWNIAMSSFKVIRAKKDLVLFPILSGFSILLVVGSFVAAIFVTTGTEGNQVDQFNNSGYYLMLFLFYVVNYFIVVFFNMALVHCARLYFKGEEFSIRDGLRFSVSRIGAIFSWALFAATIGMILRMIQENVGWLGKILVGLLGFMWSVATFFVVPVIAYENVGPVDAFKRSSQLMKQKWGESLGATFSFGLIQFLGILLVGLPLFFLGSLIDPIIGIGLAVVGAFLVISIISAAEVIFVSAVYHNINGDLDTHFDQQMIDSLFEKKSSWN